MTSPALHRPHAIPQVMISSTFTDLKEHREALIEAIHKYKLHANVMEHNDANVVGDVIDASLKMVRDSAAYILLVSHRYGQVPESPEKNPKQVSITELEFDEAQRLGRPTLLFVMSDDHPVTKGSIERDASKELKLEDFRKRAMRALPDGKVNRVYSVFSSLEDFRGKFAAPLHELCVLLESEEVIEPQLPLQTTSRLEPKRIPKPPEFYPEPRYLGSHKFVGRKSQLEELSDWAKPADPTSLLLFEAIGGSGKSMLTWEWIDDPNHALAARPVDSPWAGRFWYSFYYRGAIMADFCRHALAYMTQQPVEAFLKRKTPSLAEEMLALLRKRPWLFVLDGLERVLVHYHGIDAAEKLDESADNPTDKIIETRDPCDAIREEDNDLLRALADVKPSKILVSSRLTPRVLLNPSRQPIPGVRRIELPGLRPADAETLLRSCDVEGTSATIQAFLTEYCGNHPLVIGVFAGLINEPGLSRGNFDAWIIDPDGGARLNLASLDLVQSRNHILRAALEALPPAGHRLLSTMALLSEAVDFETLSAFNPHLPPGPAEVERPTPSEELWRWDEWPEEEKAERQREFASDVKKREQYEQDHREWLESPAYRAAEKELPGTVRDLERRGLLQWDRSDKRYDLHPVVRGIAADGMKSEEQQIFGARVIDHFSSLPHKPYDDVETLDELKDGIHVIRTLLKLGRFEEAAEAFVGDLSNALTFNLEDFATELALSKSFFPTGFAKPECVISELAATLLNNTGVCLYSIGRSRESQVFTETALRMDLETESRLHLSLYLRNIARSVDHLRGLGEGMRILGLALELAELSGDSANLFLSRLQVFGNQIEIGRFDDAELTWNLLDPMGRDWHRSYYRPGFAEYQFAKFQFYRGTLDETHLTSAEQLAVNGKNRRTIRSIHWLRGSWNMEQKNWERAEISFVSAIEMARERGLSDTRSEAGLALARLKSGRLIQPELEAERLSRIRRRDHRCLALLWRDIGNLDRARHHASAEYKEAWAEGEPYVFRYDLERAAELLAELSVPAPNLPQYDPTKFSRFPWEADVCAIIKQLRSEKEETV